MSTTKQPLRNITTDELTKILKDHKLWLNSFGKKGCRADLSFVNLSHADLSLADLRDADLRNADLRNADLSNVNIMNANLGNADLSNANLKCADLANADLSNANLSNTNLSNAILRDADLSNANLKCANLDGADLSNVYLYNTQNLPDFQHCPKNGMFIAFKKVSFLTKKGYAILELEIPADARRVSSTGTKCRADRAKVLKAMKLDGTTIKYPAVFKSLWANSNGFTFTYEVGKEVSVGDFFSNDVRVECAPGIHFFMTFEEAKNYKF